MSSPPALPLRYVVASQVLTKALPERAVAKTKVKGSPFSRVIGV
jgi:hypothetical protein